MTGNPNGRRRTSKSRDSPPQIRECKASCPFREGLRQKLLIADQPLPPCTGDQLRNQEAAATDLYTTISHCQSRLLLLHVDGDLEDELHADLVVVHFIHSIGVVIHDTQVMTEYTALSYTWGVQSFPRALHVNGIKYPITENLFAYLQRSRQLSQRAGNNEPLPIWVDAISINQYNAEEKAFHVQNMLAIYKKAAIVKVWLGEHGIDTQYAIGFLKNQGWRSHLLLSKRQPHGSQCIQAIVELYRGLQNIYNHPWA